MKIRKKKKEKEASQLIPDKMKHNVTTDSYQLEALSSSLFLVGRAEETSSSSFLPTCSLMAARLQPQVHQLPYPPAGTSVLQLQDKSE